MSAPGRGGDHAPPAPPPADGPAAKPRSVRPIPGPAPRRFVKVERVARPPRPWGWAVHEDGTADPIARSARRYRSAEEAFEAGAAALLRLPAARPA